MEEIGILKTGLRVYVDNFRDKVWINVAKGYRIVKFYPSLVDELKELLDQAKERIEEGGIE